MRKTILTAVAAVAAITFAPSAYAENGDQNSATQAVESVYNQVQAGCTPRTPPSFQSISWSSFYPASFGKGVINDANPGLGGPFMAAWDTTTQTPAPGWRRVGNWDVQLQFC
jgi:hypothetical protein